MRAGWRERLYPRLAGQPTPLLLLPDAIWSAAALWAGARQWVRCFRALGLQPGDRVVCALPADAAFVQCLIAALWEGLTLAVTSPDAAERDGGYSLVTTLDARVLFTSGVPADAFTVAADAIAQGGSGDWPNELLSAMRTSVGERTPDVRLLLRTSGTSGSAQWVALSDDNLFAVLDSHADRLALGGGCVLSILPWHHAFGLVLGLLSALLAADEIVRDPLGGRDIESLCAMAAAHPITHVDLVPLLATRLFADERGASLLRSVRGGVVGGAPVSAMLSELLRATNLRVGYGQTEASPGVMLGEPGEWSARYLGRAVGCEVRIDGDGVLAYRGANACCGVWEHGALQRLPADRWVRSGDLVHALPNDAYAYVGRAGAAFKLPNGRFVDVARWEDALRRDLPHVADVLLRACEPDALEVLLTRADTWHGAQDPDGVRAVVERVLAPLSVPLQMRWVASDGWRRTAKGEIDRRRPLAPETTV